MVIEGVALGHRREDRQVVAGVVADRELVALGLGLQPAVTCTVVVVGCHRLPEVQGVLQVTPLPVGRDRIGVVHGSGLVRVAEARLLAVGAGHPAEEVIEGAVLHHQDHHGVERSILGVGQLTRAQNGRGCGARSRLIVGGTPDETGSGGRARRSGCEEDFSACRAHGQNTTGAAADPGREGGVYIVSAKLTWPSPRRTFLSSLPEAFRGNFSWRRST